jgi:TPR repeat protein/serine/threonine protein kinase
LAPERDRWPEVKHYLAQALQLPFEARWKFIQENCRDPELQALVWLYVSNPEASLSDLSQTGSPSAPDSDSWAGKRVGVYDVRRLVGSGGFGAVYEAVRSDNTRKVVAIKFLLPQHDGEEVCEIFEAEMRFLAQMNHPNIVALLDTGTAEGRPYYVMEYVEGRNIAEYCADKRLGVNERLKLFLQVCDPVHYAHESLLVHRDLKPSNIRVTGDGRVKLLDFGVAQSSRPERAGESPSLRGAVGTIVYASPEQLFGGPITTASDIYSLGAILYELLTGKAPFRWEGVTREDLLNAVRTQIPRPMSLVADRESARSLDAGSVGRLRRTLQGDLDCIVSKALRKEPGRRYASVPALADDIRRHLEWRPVSARGNDRVYRAGRFLSRNRTPVFAAAIACIGLAVGMVASWTPRSLDGGRGHQDSPQPGMTAEEMDKLGDDYHLARGVLKDDIEAVKWYRSAADLGFSRSQSALGMMYLWGWGVERNHAEALRLFRAAAAKGDARGENGLGILYANGFEIPRDYGEAMNWYLKAAAQGYANAESNIAGMYRWAQGVRQDYGEAMRWYRKAASHGSAGGEVGIGELYCFGLGVPGDYDEALRWFHKAADGGDGFAQADLGFMHEKGWGVPPNYGEALVWYRKAAGQGNSAGERSLGFMYQYGLGVPKDLDQAIRWYRLSAEQGNSSAEAALGAIYADGIDGHPNYVEAAKWFGMPEERDDPTAMDFFGEQNEKGWGVPPNLEEAIRWYRKAAASGSKEARTSLERLHVQ